MAEIKLYNQDCLEAMRQMPDKAFDLAIVDPQYGIGEDGRKNDTRGKLAAAKSYKQYSSTDNEPMPFEYFLELKRVSKNQIIWGANHFIERIPNANSPGWVVWDKDNGDTDYADCELAYTSFKRALRRFKFKWHGMLQGDMANKESRIHPNQKPVPLYKWLLEKYAKPGDTILDTHLGSGSIAIACHDYGFDLTGYELDPDYYNAAVKRLNQHKAQFKLQLT